MKKNDFVKLCADRVGLSLKDMRDVLNIIGECITETMRDEDGVSPFMGFKFYTEYKEAHAARNPGTGEVVQVEAKFNPKARFSMALKNAINK